MNRYHFTEEPHAHWLDDKPLLGCTTVLKVLSKELTWWASSMAVGELGWLAKNKDKDGNPIDRKDKEKLEERQRERLISAGAKLTDIKGMTVKQYLDLLDMAYRAHDEKKKERALEGTDIHALAEEFIQNEIAGQVPMFKNQFEPIRPFINWCKKNVKRFLFSEIHCYSEELWTGGKTDFAYEEMGGEYVLCDIKSRDKDYYSDHVQIGGYDVMLRNGGYDKDGNKIWDYKPFAYHAVFPLGANFKEPVFSESTFRNCDDFVHAVAIYKSKCRFEEKKCSNT